MIQKNLPEVSIVIPCYRSDKQLARLLKSVSRLVYPKSKIEVVLVEIIFRLVNFDSKGLLARRVYVRKRIGYGEAANIGIRKGHGELIFLLNPDMKVDKSFLKVSVNYFTKNPGVGIVGPKVYLMDKPGKLSHFDIPGMGFNKAVGSIRPVTTEDIAKIRKPCVVDWISGSAMLFPKPVWVDLSGFDERFFLYWEDADFCMRAKEIGYEVVMLPDAVTWHKGSMSVGKKNPEKTYYIVRNAKVFLQRHSALFGKMRLHLSSFVSLGVKTIKFIFQPENRLESGMYIRGIVDFYKGRLGERK